ncbi:hypothetical protein C361_04077 [Cryptococcus neoformans Tu259-1]|uniref:Uncharacterized protein n=1 Tax=Cryptococcus neoformans Tu259-1 TaxID=1230072 RepID=A0A854QCH5_CRYNE|nr:hypothetical protein C353_03776 [Cryptococcus neoformans var. grubii AD1-83a]OXG20015.1 hypothetical protein C361_04077 [Cryptococcus neoformans var. grubii Tu259-1]OXG57722.1 hypothetical protein C354_03711 [Cryptococcus neoformans var. grubii MW-RSA1955]OXG62501.1 hypothetical protein C352_03723 [Cryptococcus neoformans var. grubii CHC193]OXG62803.1 hypothetical protein C351_03498 [Cryptococcus neoformans var. grubii c8]OXG79720.1 hypothetical protein C350_03655 [Cryptococcus neoformans v
MRDGEGCERLWSKLSKLIRLDRRSNASLRLMNIQFRVDHVNEFHGSKRALPNRSEAVWRSVRGIEKAEKAGRTAEKLEVDFRQGLEEALKNNDHVAAIQQANAVKAITTRHETLKRDICKKARELVGPDREDELQCFCRVHEALCNLQRQVITYRMTIDPILKTRSGTMERLGIKALQMGDRRLEEFKRLREETLDPSLWRDQCDEELRNGMKDKWAEKEKEGETAGQPHSDGCDESESMQVDPVLERFGFGNEKRYGDDGLLVLEEDVENVDEVQEAIVHLAI